MSVYNETNNIVIENVMYKASLICRMDMFRVYMEVACNREYNLGIFLLNVERYFEAVKNRSYDSNTLEKIIRKSFEITGGNPNINYQEVDEYGEFVLYSAGSTMREWMRRIMYKIERHSYEIESHLFWLKVYSMFSLAKENSRNI
jgi:hypothetical protein